MKYTVPALLLGVGVIIGSLVLRPTAPEKPETQKISYWVAPMDSNYRRDAPGKSPMGMDLIPVYENKGTGATEEDGKAVYISPSVINNLGVRTAKVMRGPFHRQIETVGYIDYDESKIAHIHLRAEGWIEKLYVNSVGERVQKGDVLFEVYAPALVTAQSDYLNALKIGRKDLARASKERLRAIGIPDDLINHLTKTRTVSQRVKIRAPQDGVVATLNVATGMHVTPKTEIMSLADLSTVWMLVDIFETQVSLVTEGLSAEVRLSYAPGQVWKGEISYIYPQIDPKTRTLKVRLEFENPDDVLKPDMYSDVTIFGKEQPNTLSIPREALIRTGKSERVILSLDGGKFRPAAVTAGVESGDKIEILKGLKEGENIVISAQFLIDSEASFAGSILRMSND